MKPCEDKVLLLGALIDGELDAANVMALEQHVKTCPGCAEALADLASVRALTSIKGVGYSAPEPFRRRLKIALDAESRPVRAPSPQRRGAPWRIWTAGAGVATLAAAAIVFTGIQTGPGPLADELVNEHVRSMMETHLVDIPTSDRHVVKPWFDGKVAFAPTVIDFADKGFPLVGGRLDYVARQRAAALVYRRRLHVINVFVWPASGRDVFARDRTVNGYNLVHWTAGGLNYWAVSDLDPSDLKALRDLYLGVLKGT
jgi:anti-sigma factor RsiW